MRISNNLNLSSLLSNTHIHLFVPALPVRRENRGLNQTENALSILVTSCAFISRPNGDSALLTRNPLVGEKPECI